MGSPVAKRRLVVHITLIVCGLAVCAWQAEEHFRFKRNAAEALINRGRDITSTLGVVIRSQRRFGPNVVLKDRLQSALQDLVRPEELESIAILSVAGETIASAGARAELTPEMLQARGVYWRDRTLTIMNLMDLGSTATDDGGTRPRPPIVVADEKTARAFRPPGGPRRPSDARTTTGTAGEAAAESAHPAAPAEPRPVSQPRWMPREEYESLIQKQGAHSIVISLSTDAMHRAVTADLLLRSLVSLSAMAAAIVSALAWRNLRKNAELQIRLVKAGEMNTHLTQMNFAAAGLAHETRNPLNLIRGIAQMIAMEAATAPKLKEHASTIIEEADRVTVQLNEFINYSKPREAHLAPVELAGLVADVARTLQADLEEKQIRLEHTDPPLSIQADSPLFRQALFNLLLNATQAVDAGGQIVIHWAMNDDGKAMLEIRDDGPGVPAADRTAIFKPYVTMRPKGAGLGLAIVHQIVSAHGWEIVCTENQPRGAVFRISQMLVAAAQPAAAL
ncbi:MAG TPA: ATP-binding protein [Opitutaceae bacterium]|nr:ATP-binding protein [Opitutaceae bacterium]